ncbi:MAG: hypothetical protein ACYCZZ_00285 [Minisyncoccota bacterium]
MLSDPMTLPLSPLLLLAVLLLGSAFLLASRLRLRSLVGLFQFQAGVLVVYLLWSAIVLQQWDLALIAVFVFVLKGFLMPALLLRVARQTGASERLATSVRPTLLSFIAMVAIIAAATVAAALPFEGSVLFVTVSFSLILIGFELLITHKNLFGQSVGFLVLENGIFFLGLVIADALPVVVEFGVLFDLFALLVLATALIRRAQRMHASVATDYLQALNDL